MSIVRNMLVSDVTTQSGLSDLYMINTAIWRIMVVDNSVEIVTSTEPFYQAIVSMFKAPTYVGENVVFKLYRDVVVIEKEGKRILQGRRIGFKAIALYREIAGDIDNALMVKED